MMTSQTQKQLRNQTTDHTCEPTVHITVLKHHKIIALVFKRADNLYYGKPQSHDTDSDWGQRVKGEGKGCDGWDREGLFMPWVLPDFGTNIKNGHEERIKHHEQREAWRDAEPEQGCRMMQKPSEHFM